ncbi:hypothetical protein AV530_002468 [Patagioenas fasciata monilis]|uniref:Uncharacterized protein n=1 Tax=Patagioenas fasciata monilis TaxID=372326 RepID=A0A1V4K6R2_PATFA|nr:hypothetical protein AV530_002468 [Patagioenas fasciata monilis]
MKPTSQSQLGLEGRVNETGRRLSQSQPVVREDTGKKRSSRVTELSPDTLYWSEDLCPEGYKLSPQAGYCLVMGNTEIGAAEYNMKSYSSGERPAGSTCQSF